MGYRDSKLFSVYLIENSINLKVYIGITAKTVEQRYRNHLYRHKHTIPHCVHLYAAMKKYGVDNFSVRLIDVATTWKEACQKERDYIQQYDSYNNGYNASLGGDGLQGYKWTPEQCQKGWKKFGDTQVCPKCGIEKPISGYHTRNHAHRGDLRRRPVAECKECVCKRSAEYRKTHIDQVNAWKRKHYKQKKENLCHLCVPAAEQ